MKNKKLLVGGIAAAGLLLIVGAGCQQSSDDSGSVDTGTTVNSDVSSTQDTSSNASATATNTADNQANSTAQTNITNAQATQDAQSASAPTATPAPAATAQTAAPTVSSGAVADIALTAQALGGGQVKFSWSTEQKLTDANRFIIVRSKTENPELSPKNYWIRQYHTVREVVWSNQPTGTLHYRICLTENNQTDACVKYSNDVTVNVN